MIASLDRDDGAVSKRLPGSRFLEPKSIAETSIISKTAKVVDRQVVIPVEKKIGATDNFTGKTVI